MRTRVNPLARLACFGAALVVGGESARADQVATDERACGGDAWSYAIVVPRSAPDGRYAVGPQTFCAEVARESPSPLGPIGIVIDPFAAGGAPEPPEFVPPPRRR
ncbi:hypothetical protein [Salinarimonas ramus]|uniref:Uncharacterized protein n=1 Tax=Salinarimonas ramus TaxID=690164 RepID=A0A917Q4T0_9HYPH|nr:hypothetical protein [Salinarimonas ramus]GGK23495.1 hypothetical protein GCM10011322_07780 [Salinarimonas ramus]